MMLSHNNEALQLRAKKRQLSSERKGW